MPSIMIILFSCIDTGYLSNDDIVTWAVGAISRVSSPQFWLIDLASSGNSQYALNVIRGQLRERELTLDEKCGELLIGSIYLQYIDRKITLSELEERLIDILDAYDICKYDPESICDIFSRIRNAEVEQEDVLNKAFGRYATKSKEAINYLISYDCLAKEKLVFVGD